MNYRMREECARSFARLFDRLLFVRTMQMIQLPPFRALNSKAKWFAAFLCCLGSKERKLKVIIDLPPCAQKHCSMRSYFTRNGSRTNTQCNCHDRYHGNVAWFVRIQNGWKRNIEQVFRKHSTNRKFIQIMIERMLYALCVVIYAGCAMGARVYNASHLSISHVRFSVARSRFPRSLSRCIFSLEILDSFRFSFFVLNLWIISKLRSAMNVTIETNVGFLYAK